MNPPEYDLFISYAHLDNVPLVEGGKGWVLAFQQVLETQINRLGPPRPVRIWFDGSKVQGNHELQDSIPEAVAASSLFLPILSPNYIRSAWCMRELDTFAGRADRKGRIFTVVRYPLAETMTEPPVLEGLAKYLFHYLDDTRQPRTYADPTPREGERVYFDLVQDIARHIVRELHLLPQPPGGAARVPSIDQPLPGRIDLGGRHVLVAEVPVEVQPRRDEICRYLDQFGIRAVPQAPYSVDSASFAAALAKDIEAAALFVQVLAATDPRGRSLRQFSEAREAGLPILQWRSPELRPDSITDPFHRLLVEGPSVQAVPIEDFKRALLDALRPKPVADVPTEAPMLLINADQRDRDRACDFAEALGGGIGYDVFTPREDRRQEENDEELREMALGCDAVVVFQGEVLADWVRRQMKQVHKHAHARKSPARLKWVVCQPHPPRERLGLKLPGWETRGYDEALRLLPAALT